MSESTFEFHGKPMVGLSLWLFQLISTLVFFCLLVSLSNTYQSSLVTLACVVLAISFVLTLVLRPLHSWKRYSGMVLDKSGISLRSLFKTHHFPFSDIQSFQVAYSKAGWGKPTTLIGWDLKAPTRLMKFNKRMSGSHMASPWLFGEDTGPLVELLEDYRLAAAQ